MAYQERIVQIVMKTMLSNNILIIMGFNLFTHLFWYVKYNYFSDIAEM